MIHIRECAGAAVSAYSPQAYSTVLFLTECGGPTVVLGQTPSSAPAQDAWLCWPRANQLLCFPGNFLHGVIPGTKLSDLFSQCSAISQCISHFRSSQWRARCAYLIQESERAHALLCRHASRRQCRRAAHHACGGILGRRVEASARASGQWAHAGTAQCQLVGGVFGAGWHAWRSEVGSCATHDRNKVQSLLTLQLHPWQGV